MTITGFLSARIAEDEYAAALTFETCFVGRIDGNGSLHDLAIRMNPARVLAECAAKRFLIQNAQAWSGPPDGTYSLEMARWTWATVIKALAAVYADHEDYRQEWAL
jgi:hypothetical protein